MNARGFLRRCVQCGELSPAKLGDLLDTNEFVCGDCTWLIAIVMDDEFDEWYESLPASIISFIEEYMYAQVELERRRRSR